MVLLIGHPHRLYGLLALAPRAEPAQGSVIIVVQEPDVGEIFISSLTNYRIHQLVISFQAGSECGYIGGVSMKTIMNSIATINIYCSWH